MGIVDKVKDKLKKGSNADTTETADATSHVIPGTGLSKQTQPEDVLQSDPSIDPQQVPDRIKQRLGEHQEQFKDPQHTTPEGISKDHADAEARKAEYQRQHHLGPTFDPSKAKPENRLESTVIEPPALAGLHDHEQFFGGNATSKEDIERDLKEHELRRQAILDAKSDAAGREVLEAKKKAEEVNDGRSTDAGPSEGIVDTALKAVGLK